MKYLKLLSVILVYIRNYFLVICPIYKEIILKEVPYFPIVAGMVPHLDHSNFHYYRPNYFHDVEYRMIRRTNSLGTPGWQLEEPLKVEKCCYAATQWFFSLGPLDNVSFLLHINPCSEKGENIWTFGMCIFCLWTAESA